MRCIVIFSFLIADAFFLIDENGEDCFDVCDGVGLQKPLFGILLAKGTKKDFCGKKQKDEQEGEHGRYAQTADHQRVRAEQFNKRSAQAVPAKIPHHDFAVIFSLLIENIDPDKADHVPDGFV